MNVTSEDIKDMLEDDSSLGLTFATNLFIGKEPANVTDNIVTIFDTPGYAPQLTIGDNENYYYPSIQIRVRNSSYITGWNLINEIKVLLHGRNHETWNSTEYELIRCTSEPALLDYDELNRARFIVNFDIQRH